VAEIAAYPVRADESEDDVAVSIVLKPRTTLDPRDLIRHCLADMPKYMVPRFVHLARACRAISTCGSRNTSCGNGPRKPGADLDRETDPEFCRVRPSHRKLERNLREVHMITGANGCSRPSTSSFRWRIDAPASRSTGLRSATR